MTLTEAIEAALEQKRRAYRVRIISVGACGALAFLAGLSIDVYVGDNHVSAIQIHIPARDAIARPADNRKNM
jgi:hypothetical protein